MPVTRINNNQISDSSTGNLYTGINAAVKLQDYTVTAGKIANNLTYGSDLTISGNLTVNGTSTTINTINVVVDDPMILLAKDQTGTPSLDIGFIGERGTANNIAWVWNEANKQFAAVYTSTTDSNTTITISSYANMQVLNSYAAYVSASGNITGGNLTTGGLITATGNVTGGNILTAGIASATGTITGGNLATGGTASATGNITGGNILTAGLVSATGNITTAGYFLGNGYYLTGLTTNQILNGTSNVLIPVANGNIAMSVNGTSNVVVVTSTGLNITGTESVSGNVTGGNLLTGGLVSATANVTGGNLTTAGQVSATGNVTGGNVNTAGQVSATANVTGGNLLTGGLISATSTITSASTIQGATVSATGNVIGGNVTTAGLISATGTITSASNIAGGNLTTGGQVSATGNITGGNLITAGALSAASVSASGNVVGGNVTTAGLISATGNVTGGNVTTAGLISATGNVTGGNVITAGAMSAASVSASGNVNGGNLIGAALVQGVTVSASGNVVGGNVNTAGLITATGNITGGNVITVGAMSAASVSASGNVTGGNLVTGGLVTATGNVGGGNILTGGEVSATGNVTGGNVNTNNIVGTGVTITSSGALNLSPTGNINVNSKNINSLADPVQAQDAATKNYVDSVAQGLDPKASVLAGTTSTLAVASGGTVSYNNGTSGVGATLTTTGTYTTIDTVNIATIGTRVLVKNEANAAWNGIYTYTSGTVLTRSTDTDQGTELADAFTFIEQGSTLADTGWVCTTNNPITMGTTNINWTQFSGAGSYTAGNAISLTGTVINALYDNSTIGVNGSNQLYIPANAPLVTPNIGAATGTSLSVTGNITGGNLNTGGVLSVTGNANIGNLGTTGVFATTLSATANANVGNLGTVGLITATGNVTGGNLLTGGLISATSTITSASTIQGATVSATGNVIGGNVTTAGLVSAGGNITGGNVLTGGVVSATGNVNGGNLIGAALVQGVTVSASGNIVGGNANITTAVNSATVSASGNITGGNVLTGGVVSATANVTGGNIITGGAVSATGAITSGSTISATGNISTGANLIVSGYEVVTGNVTGGNLLTGGQVSATGNVTGGNLVTAGALSAASVSASGNVTGGNVLTGGLISATGNITSAANVAGGNLIATTLVQGTTLSATGNVVGGNVNTAGLISATGNVTGGNVLTGGIMSSTGNVTGGNLVTAGVVSAGGNVTGGNVLTGGLISATGNVTGGNLITAGALSAASVSASGNVVGGNVTTAGLISATGNVTGGNITTAGQISATANITGGNLNTTGLVTASNGTIGNIVVAGTSNLGNIRISGDTITDTNGRVNINSALTAVDFAVGGNTVANVFYVNANTSTASFGSSTQTTNAIVAFNATNSILMPVGNTAQRPATGVAGMIRFNTSVSQLEFYDSSTWQTAGTTFTTIIANTQVGNGVQVAFTLPASSTTAATIVAINGVVQIPTTAYSVSGTTCTFTEAPSSSDVIDFRLLTTSTTVTSLTGPAGSSFAANQTLNEFDVTGNIIPSANVTYNLGNATNYWKSLYVGGNTIYLGSLQLKDNGSNTFAVYGSDGTTPANVSIGNVAVSSITDGTSSIGFDGVNGNAILNVAGTNIVVAKSTGAFVTGLQSVTGNVIGGNVTTAGQVSATGNITGGNILGGANVNATTHTGTTVSVTANVTGGNLLTGGLISATGNIITGAQIQSTAFAGGNISWSAVNQTDFQGSIKLGGSGILKSPGGASSITLNNNGADIPALTGTSVSATGNVTGGNLLTGGLVSATANVTGGNVTTAGQVSATGNVTGGNVTTAGQVSAGGNISGGGSTYVVVTNTTNSTASQTGALQVYGGASISKDLWVSGNIYAANVVGTVANVITVQDPLLYLEPNANVTYPYNYDIGVYSAFTGGAGNTYQHSGLARDFNDNTWKLFSNVAEPAGSTLVFDANTIYDAFKSGAITSTSTISATGTITGGNLATGGTTSATGNITGGNVLTGGLVSATGNITGGNLSVGTGTITGGNIVNSNANGVGNIGSSTTYFNTVFAKATSAQYADLAENYVADASYEPGTVISFGGSAEVTVSSADADRRVAGVVSTNPSYIMNGGLEAQHVATVALTGRVPTKVTGTVRKGDMMVSAGNGFARAEENPTVGTVIGKALEDFNGNEGVIEVVVGRF